MANAKVTQKRAAFAIEDAIADTRKRITASPQELQQKAQAALSSGPRLQTEKDGRLFAYETLDRLDSADADKATAYPFASEYTEGDEIKPYRKGPQWDGFYRDLSHLLSGTEEARRGFASIFTEVLADDISVSMNYFRELERGGKLLAFGTPGTAYTPPKPFVPTKAQRAKFSAAIAEAKGPKLSKDEPEAIERFIQDSGINRRMALVLLSKPYAEVLKAIKSDKKTADTLAALAVELVSMKQDYLNLALYISHAGSVVQDAVLEVARERIEAKQAKRKAKAK
jgi:hypothetical protein